MKSVSVSRPYSYGWHILNTLFTLRSPILLHPKTQTPAPPRESTPDLQSVRIVLPLKEQKSADSVRKQLNDLGKLLNIDLRPVFISRKVGEDLKHKEIKPALIIEQSVVYKFECGWCDASYVGYTRWHLYQRIEEHKRSGSIFNHSQSQHPSRNITSDVSCS